MALALLAGCVAPGTDYEALPFYREDRTDPSGRVERDIPLLLTTVDTWPHREEDVTEPGAAGGDEPGDEAGAEPEPETEVETDYYVRAPWPFGVWHGRGEHVYWTLTAFALGETDLANAGPVGRSLGAEDVARDPFVNFAGEGATDGGLLAIPFVFARTRTDHDAIPDVPGTDFDHDIHLWPFFAWGGGDGEEHDYLAVAPFGGTTQELLGKERITWWGFPYPFYAKVEDRSYTSHHVLWPFVNWLEGPRNSGFRVLPFYAHYERRGLAGEPIYDKTWVMWPFLSWGTSGMNEEKPTESFFFFPFYGRIEGPTTRDTTVLWPFFRYHETLAQPRRRVGLDAHLADPAAGLSDEPEVSYWELRAPFPFFVVGSGEDRFRFDLWPLFGYKERPGFARHFVLWPIWRHEAMDDGVRRFSGQWLLPFFWRSLWEDADGSDWEHKLRVYPFMHYRADASGARDIGGLSPFWADDAGFERTLGHLLRLYRYRRDRDGGVEHQALLGLFSYRDLPAVPGRPEYTRLSLLFGLFQYRDLGGEHGLRFLWLLPELTWGQRREEEL